MSKSLDLLSRNLASGMSRRKAFWSFVTSLGAIGALTGRKASADESYGICDDFCAIQAAAFLRACVAASKICPSGTCAEAYISFNGGPVLSINSTVDIAINGNKGICVPVKL